MKKLRRHNDHEPKGKYYRGAIHVGVLALLVFMEHNISP
jgi:hypothetical protein